MKKGGQAQGPHPTWEVVGTRWLMEKKEQVFFKRLHHAPLMATGPGVSGQRKLESVSLINKATKLGKQESGVAGWGDKEAGRCDLNVLYGGLKEPN